jgi:hypothetical protein
MPNDIDKIFGESKLKKSGKKNTGNPRLNPQAAKKFAHLKDGTLAPKQEIEKPKQSKLKGNVNDPFALSARSTQEDVDRTEEGWRIYTPEELNIGKGGDTDLCPFDCSCCF